MFLIPVIATESKRYAGTVLAGTVILAIAIGFDNSIGYYMSLSRTFVFFTLFYIWFIRLEMIAIALISIAVIMLFGNKYMSRAARYIFRGEWILNI